LKEEAEKLNTQVVNLDSRISKGETDIKSIQEDIETINSDIKKLNESLLAINVDASILEWIKNHTSDSIELTEEGLEVKISESENNALKLDATGLHVNDLS
jgi:chromosome segregation ATPase